MQLSPKASAAIGSLLMRNFALCVLFFFLFILIWCAAPPETPNES